jgi:hypothetical protein
LSLEAAATAQDAVWIAALDAAINDDGAPCLFPAELAARWTDNFNEEHFIGKGAFGIVYEGIITSRDGMRLHASVAVKRLTHASLLDGGENHMKREINVLR